MKNLKSLKYSWGGGQQQRPPAVRRRRAEFLTPEQLVYQLYSVGTKRRFQV